MIISWSLTDTEEDGIIGYEMLLDAYENFQNNNDKKDGIHVYDNWNKFV
jgi:hypothetical protein